MQRPISPHRFFNTIRGRLLLLVLLVIVPALVVQVFGAWRDLRGDIEARKLESVRVVGHAASDFESLLATTRTVFTDLVRAQRDTKPQQLHPGLPCLAFRL